MKNKIKKTIPSFMLKSIQTYKLNRYNNEVFDGDKQRFLKYAVTDETLPSPSNLQSQLMYFTHQIEKGLSRSNFRYGFGKNAIQNLSKTFSRIDESSEIYQSSFYNNALSALKAYKMKHIEQGEPIPNFELLPPRIIDEIENTNCGTSGVVELTKRDKDNNSNLNFYDLAMNRFSIRDFKQDEDVELEKIEEAIKISLKSPSVCNRQPSRVKIIQKKDLVEKIIDLQGGFGGYDLPNKLILVTGDLSVYLRVQERNQVYVDGGLFCMSLLLALEFKQIAACSLSVNIAVEKMNKVRDLLGLKDNEVPIMFIACGIMQDKVLAPKSYRLESETITTIY